MAEVPVLTPAFCPQPAGVAWPTTQWPRGESTTRLDEVIDEAFRNDELATTNAVIIVRHGRVVAERYNGAKEHFDRPPEEITASTPLISWSMAKSVTHFLVGQLVDARQLDPDARAPVPEWADPSDPRHEIRLRDLLAMRDGLDYIEDYVDGESSNVIEMLFGDGRPDVAGYTARRPLKHAPGSFFNYSSGTTNILSRLVADHVGYGDAYRRFMHERLFGPLGMTSAEATFDDRGVFIGSSFVHATAQDFAKFGLLYLRGGEWDGRALLSREWAGTAQEGPPCTTVIIG